jgi:hypothetical protein
METVVLTMRLGMARQVVPVSSRMVLASTSSSLLDSSTTPPEEALSPKVLVTPKFAGMGLFFVEDEICAVHAVQGAV